eukprot:GHVU01053106.1.p1 GENE.GHVU01053106.1~~GHVU01053106.1.p1  ORF type:complete len:226 (+),score=15.59 GHVU01053106.1:901-1578(+)
MCPQRLIQRAIIAGLAGAWLHCCEAATRWVSQPPGSVGRRSAISLYILETRALLRSSIDRHDAFTSSVDLHDYEGCSWCFRVCFFHLFISTTAAGILHTRTYDLSITYDKYYQTPRLWLFGFDENGLPLSPQQIFEDILTHYASKTVTVDPHPCTGIPTASIHPCKHAEMMRKVVRGWQEKGVRPRHDLSLFVLLKFISGVIPTIEYDYTMDVDMFVNGGTTAKR